MAQSVVYADLKFAAGPPATVPDDDDSPYENVPLGPVTAAPSPERWTRRWRVPTGLLAAGLLLLLLLVAIVALGACYWQVTRSLQDASREHVAEQGRLSQELQAREQSLEQTQRELGWAREALRQAWHEHNMTQRELRSRNAELGHAQQKLAVLQEEVQEVQGKLNSSERAVSSLRACVNTECCPEGWILYRSKCLYFSVTQQNWDSSFLECRDRSARLLSEGDWPSFTLPNVLYASSAEYWIGARFFHDTKKPIWVQTNYPTKPFSSTCGSVVNGEIKKSWCNKLFQCICEKSPNLSSTSKTQPPVLDKY